METSVPGNAYRRPNHHIMKLVSRSARHALLALGLAASTGFAADVAKKQVLLLAGNPSHPHGEHEHNAGMRLLKKCLDESGLPVESKVYVNAGWPSAEEMAVADTIVFYCDGGGGHVLLKDGRIEQVEKAVKRGVGFVCLHYAVEFPKDKGGPQALEWMGGFFEADWSVNPHWLADYKQLPKHPISNGVNPFSSTDEWYFHMRFADASKGKRTDILTAIAPDSTMSRKDGPHEGNPAVRAEVAAKKPQSTAWAFERKNGGRGFGFTGGHFHKGWGNDDQRKLVLNAILWTAKGEIPAAGVPSKVSAEELSANLDPKGQK
jgi:type 1 glutamine amidotransferase